MKNRLMIINDGRDYYLIEETLDGLSAEKQQELLKKGELTNFNPIYRFTFLDKLRNNLA